MSVDNLDQDGISNLRAATRYSAADARRHKKLLDDEAARIDAERKIDRRDSAVAARLLD